MSAGQQHLVPRCCITFLQAFGAGLLALGVLAVIASLVSPDQGGIGTIFLGVVLLFVGIAVFVVAGRRSSRTE
jgi:FtsH-binding integral membrane protein